MNKEKLDFSILDKFNFETTPIGIKFTVEPVEGVPRITKKMTLCEMIKWAQDGKVFYAEAEDHTCEPALYILGQKDVEKAYINGEFGTGLQLFESPRSASRLYQHIYKIDRGTINYLSFAPLKKMTFEPDVLLITADTTQAEIIMRASSYKTGDMWISKYTAALGCDWLLVFPYISGEINRITTGMGFGMRRRHIFPEGLHLISVPFDKLPSLLQTLREFPWVPEPYKPDGLEYVRKLRTRLGLDKS
jgi:uncharacterized protein (DUF169 family)